MSPRPADIEVFIDQLVELELEPALLRSDPGGERWLPIALRRMVAEDPACARELREFVEMELELHAMQQPSDAFFTRRVMDGLPEIQAIDDRRRTWILASAYALAIGVVYVLLGPLLSSGEVASVFAPVHDWYHDHALEAGGMWVTLALLCVAGVLTLAPTQRRRADA